MVGNEDDAEVRACVLRVYSKPSVPCVAGYLCSFYCCF